MPTECIPDLFGFKPAGSREVVAAFDGGRIFRIRLDPPNGIRSQHSSPWEK